MSFWNRNVRPKPVSPSSHCHSITSDSGFTLTEVLLAVAILAVVSVLVSVSFTTTFRMLEIVEDDGGREHMARSCLTLIAHDLTTARQQMSSPMIGRNGDMNGQPADVLAFLSAGQLRSRPNAQESDLTRVLYAREDNRLVRIATANPYIVTAESVERLDVAVGVAAFNVRYYDRALQVWTDVWEGQGRTTLPTAVRIELTLLNARKEPRTYTEYVTIPAYAS
jgi:type II secretion system protein J